MELKMEWEDGDDDDDDEWCNESAVDYFNIISQHFPEKNEEIKKMLQNTRYSEVPE
jgi:hypothetical protein